MASAFGPKVPWRPDLTRLMSWTPDQNVWELYHINDDFSQADDLAAKEPAKLIEKVTVKYTRLAANRCRQREREGHLR